MFLHGMRVFKPMLEINSSPGKLALMRVCRVGARVVAVRGAMTLQGLRDTFKSLSGEYIVKLDLVISLRRNHARDMACVVGC